MSNLKINNKSIEIPQSSKIIVNSSEELLPLSSIDQCYFKPCQNFGECIPSLKEFRGFRCQCSKEFQGQFCQIRSNLCSNGGLFYLKIFFEVK